MSYAAGPLTAVVAWRNTTATGAAKARDRLVGWWCL